MNDEMFTTFRAALAEARASLDKIADHLDQHLGVDPDSLHWGNVGDAGLLAGTLDEIVKLLKL